MRRNEGYLVALTDQPTPLKYQIIDHRVVVFHEAIGRNDGQRLNALFVESELAANEFLSDFDLLWDGTSQTDRDKNQIMRLVRRTLGG
jgi:hypothetical protein